MTPTPETCTCRDCVRLRTNQRRLTVALCTILAVGLVVLWREICK